MKKVNANIAKSLKKLRNLRGMTQGQVAEAVGIEPTSYAYYEYGKRSPRPEILEKLALLFDVSVADLHKGEDAPQVSLSEATPMDELLRIIQKKTSSIPDDVLNLAMYFSHDDEVWEVVRGALERGIKSKSVKSKSKRKA